MNRSGLTTSMKSNANKLFLSLLSILLLIYFVIVLGIDTLISIGVFCFSMLLVICGIAWYYEQINKED